jgi:hypothetical protein
MNPDIPESSDNQSLIDVFEVCSRFSQFLLIFLVQYYCEMIFPHYFTLNKQIGRSSNNDD